MLEGLNPEQREAVLHPRGPLLVIAGAGSGKTRVLTTRIAHLITERGVRPEEILAFTFTNKAAREMRERVERMVPDGARAWIGTFHATGVRILRREAPSLGYPRDFSIYDADDSRTVIKGVLKSRHADPKRFSPRDVAAAVSRFKNASISPSAAQQSALSYPDERMAEFYADYERTLRTNRAMDFDDLIVKPVELFESHEDIQKRYSQRFVHVLVDEFQDTNPLQLLLTKALSHVHDNLFAVGDDDQAIYSWRGATVENMLEFEDYFPGASVQRLERNYRSTGNILKAANTVIAHNRRRRGKNLWTEAADGAPLELSWAEDEEDEGSIIRAHIQEVLSEGQRRRQDVVVLYRTNAQSRALEDSLRRAGLPYQIVGGTRFYERREVRDVLGYLKLVVNPADQVALERVINVPKRGVGKTSLERLLMAAQQQQRSALELARDPFELERVCGKAPAARIGKFVRLISELQGLNERSDASQVLSAVLQATGYLDHLKNEGASGDSVERQRAVDRQENVQELLNAAHAFVSESDEGRLADFLESVALLADVDRMDSQGDMVTLMTMHNAKGLEFPIVIVAGCEENLLPHANSMGEEDSLEEERRLFYVALTRGRERVLLTSAAARRRFGGLEPADASRFLAELPEECVVEHGERRAATWESYGVSTPPGRSRRQKRAAEESAEGVGAFGVDAFRRSAAKQKASAHGFDEHDFNQEERTFEIGTRVRHALLGEGRVEAVEGFGELTKLTIEFGDAGRKRILVRYAQLEILD